MEFLKTSYKVLLINKEYLEYLVNRNIIKLKGKEIEKENKVKSNWGEEFRL